MFTKNSVTNDIYSTYVLVNKTNVFERIVSALFCSSLLFCPYLFYSFLLYTVPPCSSRFLCSVEISFILVLEDEFMLERFPRLYSFFSVPFLYMRSAYYLLFYLLLFPSFSLYLLFSSAVLCFIFRC